METLQGIQFEHDASGNAKFVRINLDEYGDKLLPFLKKLGILEPKDDFDLEWENAIPADVFLKNAIEKIKQLPWKK